MSGRVRAVALGYQGFGNVGDEAILAGIEQLLVGSPVEVVAVVGGHEPIPAFATARRIATHRMRPNLASLRALGRARLLLVSGGGLLHDHWATVVPTYLAWSILARVTGARVVWVGVGVGPLNRPMLRRMASWALRLAACVTVRDAESALLVASIAPRVKVTVVPDPALLMAPPAPRSRGGIGFVVRGPTPGHEDETDGMAVALAEAVAGVSTRERSARLLTLGGPRDRAFAKAVRGLSTRDSTTLPIEELSPDPRHAIEVLAGLQAVVTVRLHGLLLAALAGTPAVPIAYDDKVSSMARQLGLDEICQPAAGLTGHGIIGALAAVQTAAQQERVADRVSEMRSSATLLRSLIEEAAL